MRLSKQRADDNRDHILEKALELFSAHGFDAVGVARLMRAAGFTHGGFYNHFESKRALAAEACARAFTRSQLFLAREPSWQAYVQAFLAEPPTYASTLAGLAADVARQPREVQDAFAKGIESLVDTLSRSVSRGHALRRLSELVGTWVLARAVSRANPQLSSEILRAAREHRE